MTDIVISQGAGCEPDAPALWDTAWFGTMGDWRLALPYDQENPGGLTATAGLFTAAAICLFTDLRVPPSHTLAWLADGDPRGWHGDGSDVRADLGETPLGSLLWLLERAPMVIGGVRVETWAQQLAAEALQTLVDQGMVAKIVTAAAADQATGHLYLQVGMFGANGAQVYDQQFELLWQQVFHGGA